MQVVPKPTSAHAITSIEVDAAADLIHAANSDGDEGATTLKFKEASMIVTVLKARGGLPLSLVISGLGDEALVIDLPALQQV